MKLLSVNVSLPKTLTHQGKSVTTGIFKQPVHGRVMVRFLGLDGDGQADRTVHGGVDMAVYAYPVQHYAFWERELQRAAFPHGQFGENLTVEGLAEDTVRVGDILRVGNALLQVTQPRIPCYKLAMRMGQGLEFPQRFQASGRMGFYCRVLEEGEIGAGDTIEGVDRDDDSVTIAEFIQVYLSRSHDPDGLERVLASRNLSESWRKYLRQMLDKATPVPDPGGWEGYRAVVVDRKVPESETITSFYLVPEDGNPLAAFEPGQFLTYRLDIPGQSHPVTRTYTLSDSPGKAYYRLTVKREPTPGDRPDLPPGLASNFFHDRLEIGARLCVRAPRGNFHLDRESRSPVVLLSGGVGLTPMVSMLNAIVESGSRRPVWFIHGTRNGREHALGAHVRRFAAEHDNVSVHICYSRPDPQDVMGRDYDSPGHVEPTLLQRLLPDRDFDFFLCGPTPFMKALYNGLLAWGVAETRIHYEFFGPARTLKEGSEATAKEAASEATRDGAEVVFAKSGVAVAWDPSCESILELAEAHGLHPDYSCRAGICHTCMCTLQEGEVEYAAEPAELPDPGCVLICCSRPRARVVIDL